MATRPPELYGRPVSEVMHLCRISLKTARRWKQGQSVPPETALMILRGDLGCFDSAWSGWRLQNGFLVSPEGWTASVNDVLSLQFLQAQLQAWRHEALQLRAE